MNTKKEEVQPLGTSALFPHLIFYKIYHELCTIILELPSCLEAHWAGVRREEVCWTPGVYLAGMHTSSGLKYSKVNLFDRLIQPPALPALPCLHPVIQHIVFHFGYRTRRWGYRNEHILLDWLPGMISPVAKLWCLQTWLFRNSPALKRPDTRPRQIHKGRTPTSITPSE